MSGRGSRSGARAPNLSVGGTKLFAVRLLAAASLPALCPSLAGAQPTASGAEPAPADAAPLAGGAALLPPMVVTGLRAAAMGYQARRTTTATRTDTPLRDVPQSVSVTTQQAIRDLSMQNLQDVLRYTPGAGFAQGEGNRDTPVLRGNSTTASLFVDGIRDDVEYYRDLYNVDRVEVLLGPNAMIFGRGGAGGVVNRVTMQADWNQIREVRLQAGSFDNRRATFDLGQGITENAAFRVTGMYEDSESYRDGVEIRRYGINPTLAFRIGNSTSVRIGYENFRDERVADRGVPSFRGRPLDTGVSTYFGDPNNSPVHVNLNAVNLWAEHRFENGVTLRNHARYALYDKFYQNIFPGAVNAAGTAVSLAAYNNATKRENLFNQTDALFSLNTGPIRHNLLVGVELSHQITDNFRNTGYFTAVGPNATNLTTPLNRTRIRTPVSFRQSATDANNSGTATGAALYVQDQVELLPQLHLIAGLRYENFDVDFRNNRNGDRFKVSDNTVSPRLGLVYKPWEPVSVYVSYSNSYLPRAGEQLSSLSLTNQSLRPEEFTNYEVGAKWDVNPGLSLTAALFRLDRSNVATVDPTDVTRSILVDGQRTEGFELGLRGRVTEAWSVLGGYAHQDGEITSTQSATIVKGNAVPFQSRNTFSLWNRYDFTEQLGAGVGIINQSSYFPSADNQVRVPGFTRVDGALFWAISERWLAQVNVENIFGAKYYPVAHSNNNITPGAPVSARFALTARF
jgi:catecholate siderophore receptor